MLQRSTESLIPSSIPDTNYKNTIHAMSTYTKHATSAVLKTIITRVCSYHHISLHSKTTSLIKPTIPYLFHTQYNTLVLKLKRLTNTKITDHEKCNFQAKFKLVTFLFTNCIHLIYLLSMLFGNYYWKSFALIMWCNNNDEYSTRIMVSNCSLHEKIYLHSNYKSWHSS